MDVGDRPVATAKATVTSVVKPLDLLLIRDDGYLCMGNTDILALNPRLRVYHGTVRDDWDTRMKFLSGQDAGRWGAAMTVIDPGKVDITRMSREDLITFALDEYSVTLKPDTEYAHALVAVIGARTEQEEKDKARAAKGPPPGKGIH